MSTLRIKESHGHNFRTMAMPAQDHDGAAAVRIDASLSADFLAIEDMSRLDKSGGVRRGFRLQAEMPESGRIPLDVCAR